MTDDQLLAELKQNACLDLVKLYHANPRASLYALLERLYQLRQQHQLTTRISPFISEIESITQGLQPGQISAERFAEICQALDLNQRAHKMSRFILTQDNHSAFAKPVDLVMFGDSITEWGPWHDALPNIPLSNRGLAGDTTAGMVQRLETTTLHQPKLVCVMAGINDLAQGYSVEHISHNYAKMVDFWCAQDIEVWVQSTLYVGERMAALNPKVTQLNQQLQQMCEQKQVRFLDLNQVICPQQVLPLDSSCDDLHLNSTAYKKWLHTLTPLLAQAL